MSGHWCEPPFFPKTMEDRWTCECGMAYVPCPQVPGTKGLGWQATLPPGPPDWYRRQKESDRD